MQGFPGGSVVKNVPTSAGNKLGKIPGEENDNPLQYSHLGNLMERGAWQAVVHRGAKESDMTKRQ